MAHTKSDGVQPPSTWGNAALVLLVTAVIAALVLIGAYCGIWSQLWRLLDSPWPKIHWPTLW